MFVTGFGNLRDFSSSRTERQVNAFVMSWTSFPPNTRFVLFCLMASLHSARRGLPVGCLCLKRVGRWQGTMGFESPRAKLGIISERIKKWWEIFKIMWIFDAKSEKWQTFRFFWGNMAIVPRPAHDEYLGQSARIHWCNRQTLWGAPFAFPFSLQKMSIRI